VVPTVRDLPEHRTLMPRNLAGRVLVITGASAGIGAATALAAGSAAMRVVLAARRVEKLEEVAGQVRAAGGQALVVPLDVAEEDQAPQLIERAVDAFGRVDALFANAGFGHFHELIDESSQAAEQQMWRVNYFGALACIRAAGRQMIGQGDGGHILINSSIVALSGLPYYGSYAATKGALHALACSLRGELLEHGIHVTAVYPVGTDTEFSQAVRRTSGQDVLRSNTPRLFMQTPQHVARRVLACLRRPRPEVWPSRLSHLGAAIWTLLPRVRTWSFRGHVRKARRTIEPRRDRSGGL
jgi:short-subunit dehydrogenase